MKLHLPLFIRKSVLACMLALSSIATTVVSGTMVAGSAMWVIYNVAAEAQEEVQTVTITDNEDGRLTTTPAGSLIIMNLQGTSAGRWLIGPGTTHNVLADVQIDSLSITNGSSSATYNFTGDITGDGVFERTNNASASKQTYVFTGDMSQYSGNMNLAKENDGSTFCFVGNQSGTGNISIAAGNSIAVDGAVMNNSSITSAGTLTVSGNSFFAGDVTSTGTLNVLNKATFNHNVNVNGNLFLGAGALIINDGLFTFGDAVTLDLSNVGYTINDQGQRVFSLFSSDSTGTSNFSSLTANNLSVIEKVGWDWSFNQNGTIVATRLGRDVSYAGGTLSWSTAADNKSFTQGSAAVSFELGDNVTFAGDSQVTLAEDIQATRVIVGSEAEVAVHSAGHALAADIVEVEGALRYQLGGENSSILDLMGSGTLVLDNADADSAASFSIGGDVSAFTGGLTVQGNTTLALHGKANGLFSASEASVTIGDGAVLKVENTAGWHTIWRLNDATNLHTTGTGTIDVVDRGWLTVDVDILKNFSCETSFILHGDGFYSNKRRNVFVGEGAGFYVDDTLTLMTYVALVVQGGTIDAGTLAVGNAQYWSKFFMSSGLLTAGSIKLSSHNGDTEVNISGGCVEFTQSQALNRAGNSAPVVRIVGSGPDSTVTLKATRTDWTLDGAGLNNKPVIGNITVDAGNTHGITLANVALTGSIVNNAGLTLGEGISVAAGSSAVLSGATIAIDRTITNAGTLSLQTGSVSVSRENLQRLEISTEGATIAYSLDGKNFVTDGSENGFRHLTNARYYLAAGGNLSVAQGLQAQVGENSYNIFADATGLGFIVPETSRSDVFVVNSGNVTVGAEAQAIAESYEINGGTMVLNAGSVAGESVHFNSASSALHIGGESSITGALVLNQGSVTVSGGHVNTLNVAGGSATLNGGSADTLLVGGSNGSVEVTGAFSTTSLRLSENGSATLTIKDGGNLTITGTNNTHSTNSSFMLGHWPYSSTLRQEGGELNARETIMYPSWDGNGTYQALGGVANLKGIYFWAHNGGAFAGSFLLGDETTGTARVNFGSFGIVDINSSVLVKLGNGTLGATADWGMTYNGGYAAAAVQLIGTTTGTIFNTEDAFAPGTGHIITINPVLTGNGKLVKEGIGSLYLKGANTYGGGTIIHGGYLLAGNETALGSGQVYLAGGELKLNTALTVGEMEYTGGELNLNKKTLNITRELTASRQLSLNSGTLDIENGAIYNGKGIIAQAGTGTAVRVQNAELNHVGYDLTFNAGTSLEVAGNSTIRGNVSLLADSLFKLEQAATLSLQETLQADAAELTVQGTALLAGSSTLNASLTLADGATLDMMSLDAGAVTINGALTLGGQVKMGEHLLAAVEELTCWEPGMVLFTGLTDLVLPVAASEQESYRVLASSVFSNVENPDLYVTYHVVDNVGSLLVMNVPEPATSTLSLLALTALALRRRRK